MRADRVRALFAATPAAWPAELRAYSVAVDLGPRDSRAVRFRRQNLILRLVGAGRTDSDRPST